jgi:hypothetical protein
MRLEHAQAKLERVRSRPFSSLVNQPELPKYFIASVADHVWAAAAAEFSDVGRGEAGILGEIARSDSVRVVVSHAYIRGTAAIPDRWGGQRGAKARATPLDLAQRPT